ncbi:MAG: alpha,alpha-trehalase TreF [Bacteroidales bacterium]|nr:alpha,alpha-trehalase TreF [Bacteroidales bacterium]
MKNHCFHSVQKSLLAFVKFIITGILLGILLFCRAEHNSGLNDTEDKARTYLQFYNPALELPLLFHDVQISGIFPDSKTFPDCQPKISPDSIAIFYEDQKDQEVFDLKNFIDDFFSCPVDSISKIDFSVEKNIEFHLHSLWNYLIHQDLHDSTMNSLLPLVFPYVVPGGRFREIYYWDSYFTMEGLAASGRMDLVKDMLNNFVYLINECGHIPNGNRSYYLSRSQPPFFAEMVKLLMRESNDAEGLKYLPALVKEYKFWMNRVPSRNSGKTVEIDNVLLNRYWDEYSGPRPEAYRKDYLLARQFQAEEHEMIYRNIRTACESGWDFSSRWFRDGKSIKTICTTEIIPVDLNCLLYNLELTISKLYALKQLSDSSEWFNNKASERKELIGRIFWNEEEKFYFDYDILKGQRTNTYSLAAIFPLYFKIATTSQAKEIAKTIELDFLFDGGLITTLSTTGEQWDAPNGWAPLQWIAVCGLENYGYKDLANKIASRWLALNNAVYQRTGKMMEKYNVMDLKLPAGGGEYPLQDGFGWTNGVYLGLRRKGYVPEKWVE